MASQPSTAESPPRGIQSQAGAEHKVARLLDEIARGFKAVRPDIKKVLPKPITKVWRWHE
ncbi:MAG: hypothetical protein M3082_01745 [Candidatus Dormibacteraeota bacterium]|nr:hypothetical protein [Candidatus Dormibacteraeota bacterium]